MASLRELRRRIKSAENIRGITKAMEIISAVRYKKINTRYRKATPFFEGVYEMRQLPIPRSLQSNISYRYYEAGHMVYVNEGVLKQFHTDLVSFVRSTSPAK